MTLRPALLLVVALSGCSYGYAPITDEEVEELGLTQGMAGNAALRTGNCMPSSAFFGSDCRYEPLEADLWVIPEDHAGLEVAADSVECGVRIDRPANDLDALVVPLASGRYGVELVEGRYMPLIVESNGCANCIRGGWDGDSTLPCPLVTISSGLVSKEDALLDRAAH